MGIAIDVFNLKKSLRSIFFRVILPGMKRKAKTSKFIRMYGMTLREMAKHLGMSPYRAYIMHLQNPNRKKDGEECSCATPAISK